MKKIPICTHCGEEYIPKRRGVQKFCSNSCRSRYWYLKQNNNNNNNGIKALKVVSENNDMIQSTPSEKMSWAGFGNAVTGAGAAKIVSDLLTPEYKKPATKKDIQEIKSLISGVRYLPVNNAENDTYGRKPFYDIETGYVVYLYQ
ncbi:hypothetical protein [Yeosuana marina]|uniref:hypothetical protein n=1 Tax=Yeosuana marina TaxID=1565536 RepID=UPI001423B32E|nr:hypothetical protein [Yeosuana marina]